MPSVLIVHQALSLRLVVPETPRVSVTLGIQGQMEEHVHSVVSTNTKQYWGLPIALIVHRILFLRLVVSQEIRVGVTLDTQA